jgi:hypothetical protein
MVRAQPVDGGHIHLLPGEHQERGFSDPAHWVSVYEELVNFCWKTLADPQAGGDLAPLSRRLIHFESRLTYWLTELEKQQTAVSGRTG